MSTEPHRISPPGIPETVNTASRYASLIHILNGEEEFMLDQDGIIIGSNLEAVNVTGYEEYEIIGKPISIIYLADETNKAKADLDKATRLGRTIVTGIRVKKRGVNFWAKMKIEFMAPAQTGGPSFRVILKDTTHRALSKERMRTLRDEYLSIFNNPFVGTFKFRMEDFVIQMCNQKTLDILGVHHSKELRLNQFFSSSQEFDLFLTSLKSNKKLEGFKFLVHSEESQPRTWAVISARYFESQAFAEGVLFDITEQHQQMVELQRVNAELDNFIYHASHDLRSPLTSIMGLVNLALWEDQSDTMNKYLNMIRGRVDHLDVLLKDLISVSTHSNADREIEAFHFESEVNTLLKFVENTDRPFKITLDIVQKMDFKTDVMQMRTILRNLLSNAFKYFNPEVPQPFIHLRIRVTPSHCAILLKDNGIGIHQKYKHKVYDMFFRATERSNGSGLGLYIVKSMVEKLNGRISFESTLNVGTTFLLTIPNQEQSNTSIKQKDIHNFLMLTSKQIELVENTWNYILLHSQEAGMIFYKKLFAMDPALRHLFKGDMQVQSEKLVAMITFIVHKLNSLDEIIADVRALGKDHTKYSIIPEYYNTVATALLWTLEQGLGKEWNEEVKEAWYSVYSALSKIMIDAAQE